MNIPDWWLVITATFCVLGILVLFALIVGILIMARSVAEAGAKVKVLSGKVETVVDNATEVSKSVGQSAINVANKVEDMTISVGRKFETIATVLLAAATARRLVQMMREKKKADG